MITNNKIISYITNRNWVLENENEKFWFFIAPIELGFEENYLLPIPKNSLSNDYKSFLRNTLFLLSDIYEISIDELEAIIEDENAVFSIRISDETTEKGKIAFKRFEELIEGLKDLLLDAASFVINPSLQNKSKPAEAYKYLNNCKFLQTEVGSFIAKIELPSNELIKKEDLFNSEIKGEEINEKLISVLSFVNTSIFESNLEFGDNYLEENREFMNINILKDIEKIYEKTESTNLEFSLNNVTSSLTIETENIYNGKLINLSKLIENIDETLKEENNVTLTGRITSLKSYDPETNSNEIIFSTLFENKPINVKANLNMQQYKEALDAHKDKKNIQISGKLKKMKTQYKFIELQNFQIAN